LPPPQKPIAGHLSNRVSEPVLQRTFQYWKNVDEELGHRIEQAVRAGQTRSDPIRSEKPQPRPAPRVRAQLRFGFAVLQHLVETTRSTSVGS
jgi:hypothetical protein